MGLLRGSLVVVLMTAIATLSYFCILMVARLDYPQAVAIACVTTVLVPFAIYKPSKDKREQAVMRGQVFTLLLTAAIAAVLPYLTTMESWLFPAWYLIGVLGVGIIIRLTNRLDANGPRLTDKEIEQKKEMRLQYMALEEDVETELEASIPDDARFQRKMRILRYLRMARKRLEEEILEANDRATLRPPPALGSDPHASPPKPRPNNGAGEDLF